MTNPPTRCGRYVLHQGGYVERLSLHEWARKRVETSMDSGILADVGEHDLLIVLIVLAIVAALIFIVRR